MNKHVRPKDFEGATALKLVAVPAAGDTATYLRLAEMRQAAHALFLHIVQYQAIPCYPENADYRQRAIETIEEAIADMRKAMNDG